MAETIFLPDENLEPERLLAVEQVLGEGGLIDRHLRWVQQGEAPSATVSHTDYGYFPMKFTVELETNSGELRPGQEPVDYQLVSTSVLGLPYDTPYPELARRIADVDHGWYDFLVEAQLLDTAEAEAMRRAATEAYTMGTLTEDNLPAYVSELLGIFRTSAVNSGLAIPAIEEWSRGIWTGEEHGHDISMNEHGKITDMTTTPEQIAARNSQLRAGIDTRLHNVIQTFAYTAWQELSTYFAHKRNGDLLGPVGNALMAEIKSDEARHFRLNMDVLGALLELFPDDTVRVLKDVLLNRFMPGSRGIPNFTRRSVRIHNSGVFGVDQGHEAARVVLQQLGLLRQEAEEALITDEGKQALSVLEREFGPQKKPRKLSGPFILGETVTANELRKARSDYAAGLELPANRRLGQVVARTQRRKDS